MALQTNYPSNIPAGVAGAKATMAPATIVSGTVTGTVSIPFGAPVSRGAAQNSAIPYAAASGLWGLALLDRSIAPSQPAVDAFVPNSDARIMTQGDAFVNASVAVTRGQPVYVTPAGLWTNTDNSSANELWEGATWETTTTAAGLAVIRIV